MNRSKQVVSRAGSALAVLTVAATIGACSAEAGPARSEPTAEATEALTSSPFPRGAEVSSASCREPLPPLPSRARLPRGATRVRGLASDQVKSV
jgi:hypothetical protein